MKARLSNRLAGVPLRWQLAIVMLALVFSALLIVNLSATALVQNVLVSRLDSQLLNTVRDQSRRGGPMRVPQQIDSEPRNGPALLSGYYVRVVTPDGEVSQYLRSPEGEDRSGPAIPAINSSNINNYVNRPFTVPSVEKSDDDWRVLVSQSDNGTIYMSAVGLSDVHATLKRFMAPIVVLSAVTLLLVGLLGYWLVRSRLRALREVETTAARIAKGDLSQRVPEHDPRTEIGSLGSAINTMLTRIEASFAAQKASENAARESESRMRRFVGDASHELRTPLTSIRGYAELTRQTRGAASVSDTEQVAIARIESEAQRMSLLVDDLLLLARLDQQATRADSAFDLAALLDDIATDAPIVGPQHNFTYSRFAEPLLIHGDRDQMRRAISNLVTNAFRHTPNGSNVFLALDRIDGSAIVSVSDNGPGIPVDDRAKIFDRFFRSDQSRDRASGGTGLGLSIVQGIVTSHLGTVEVEEANEGGARFVVRLPVVEGSPSSENGNESPEKEADPE